MQKKFKGNVEPSRNAVAAWDYCAKEDTRKEGPLSHGIPPAAKNVKGDTIKRNKMILEYGLVKAVDEGLVRIEQVKQIKQSVDVYNTLKK